MNQVARFLREPLLHFLVVGAALFAAYAWVNRGGNQAPAPQVRLADSDVRWLKETFMAQYQREPNAQELNSLVHDFVKEELFAREAQELGLDKDDIVIRRRLAQKMTFLLQDNSPSAAPSDDELRRLYETQRGRSPASEADTGPQTLFTRPRISFTQVFFSRDQRTDAAADARAALLELARADAASPPAEMGDRSAKSEFRNVDERTVANQFGGKFAAELFELAPGGWQGPIESSHGAHLVRVTALKPAELRPFEEVRDQLVEMWHQQSQRDNEEHTLVTLLKKYQIAPDEDVKALIAPLLEEAAGAGSTDQKETPSGGAR